MNADQTVSHNGPTPASQAQGSALTPHKAPLPALTGIRFFAATYVIVFHTQFALRARARHAGPADTFIDSGFLAVTLFFILSGFILAYTYQGQIQGRSHRRRFWEARFARLWPLYAVALLFQSLVTLQVPPPPVALATVLMVQAWNPFHPAMAAAWSPVLWTLSVEALFYLLFPFAQAWLDRRSASTQLGLLFGVLLVALLMNVSWRTLNYAPVTGLYQHIPLAVIHLPEFFTGVLLGNLCLRRMAATHPGFALGRGWWTWTAAAASLAVLSLRTVPLTSLAIPAFAALILGLATEKTLLQRLLSAPLLVLGGQISYGMYLLHIPCKTLLSAALDHLGVASSLARFLAVFVSVVLLSWLTFRTIEDPCRKLLRRLFSRLEARSPTT